MRHPFDKIKPKLEVLRKKTRPKVYDVCCTILYILKSMVANGVSYQKEWIVESAVSWLERFRRLWKNCERKSNISLNMVAFAYAAFI